MIFVDQGKSERQMTVKVFSIVVLILVSGVILDLIVHAVIYRTGATASVLAAPLPPIDAEFYVGWGTLPNSSFGKVSNKSLGKIPVSMMPLIQFSHLEGKKYRDYTRKQTFLVPDELDIIPIE